MNDRDAVVVRPAELEDADSIVTVLRRSITELCIADHRNDPGVLGAWLENKTTTNVRAWIESPRNFMVVAEVARDAARGSGTAAVDSGTAVVGSGTGALGSGTSAPGSGAASAARVCGVASMSTSGGILLCYVLPDVQSAGVGRALLATLESEARLQGIREVSLESTVSARGFYSRQGYRPRGNGPADSSLLCKVLGKGP